MLSGFELYPRWVPLIDTRWMPLKISKIFRQWAASEEEGKRKSQKGKGNKRQVLHVPDFLEYNVYTAVCQSCLLCSLFKKNKATWGQV